jgi:hypothetical protein
MDSVLFKSLSTFSAVSDSPGPAMVIAPPLTGPLRELRSEVDKAVGKVREVEPIMVALTVTKSVNDVAVERDVSEPMRMMPTALLGIH